MSVFYEFVDAERSTGLEIERRNWAVAPNRRSERREVIDRISGGEEVGGSAKCLHAPSVGANVRNTATTRLRSGVFCCEVVALLPSHAIATCDSKDRDVAQDDVAEWIEQRVPHRQLHESVNH